MSCARSLGGRIRLFNGRDGEWEGAIETLAAHRATVRPVARRLAQPPAPDLRLLFAPLKAERTRFVVEKATELGVGALQPVFTLYGQTRRVNVERLRAHAIEAAEQCGRLEVPNIDPPCPLTDALADWPPERRLLVCDPEAESNGGRGIGGQRHRERPGPILIGPEGGFAPAERRLLADHPAVRARPPGPPTSCAPRPQSRRRWPAGRPSPATGDETAPRRTQPCYVRARASEGLDSGARIGETPHNFDATVGRGREPQRHRGKARRLPGAT